MVALVPACANPCTLLKTAFLHVAGTTGRREPVKSSHNTSSIILWEVWPDFRRPKGILRNSKSPNGVMMAVFHMLSPSTGTWLYPFLKSSFVNTLHPCSRLVRSAILGQV